MAIIGFIFLVLLALWMGISAILLFIGASSFGGFKGSDAAGISALAVFALWLGYVACAHAPFHITFS